MSTTEANSQGLIRPCSAASLAAIRIVVFAILLANALWEDLPSVACLPESMRCSMGVLSWLYELPIGFAQVHESVLALQILQFTTVICLFLALIGYRCKIMVPLATVCALLMGGILREYAHFYHTLLLPMHLGFALSFMPCGDALSIDSFRKSGFSGLSLDGPSSMQYGLCRYLCWILIVAPYFLAALSKLRNGGINWWNASNMRAILLNDSLNPMLFDFDFGLWEASGPDWVLATAGLCGLLLEFFSPAVLFSQIARRIMPILFVGLHLGILLSQNIFFFDLMLIHVVFFNWRPVLNLLSNKIGLTSNHLFAKSNTRQRVDLKPANRLTIYLLVSILLLLWIRRIEHYPLTGWQMYSGRSTSNEVRFITPVAHYQDGSVKQANFDEWIGALKDARYRRILRSVYRPQADRSALDDFLSDCLNTANSATVPLKIESFEIQCWKLDIADYLTHGLNSAILVDTHSFPSDLYGSSPGRFTSIQGGQKHSSVEAVKQPRSKSEDMHSPSESE